MEVTITGKISEQKINEILSNQQIEKMLEGKVNDRINGIVNKHFNAENTNQYIRENFNKSVARLANTDEFKELLKEALVEKVNFFLSQKDFTSVINSSVKNHIDNIVKNIQNLR